MPAEPMLIAIVDDDESVRLSVASLVRSLGYRAAAHASAEGFLASADRVLAACIISDIRMPGMDGIAMVRELRVARSRPPVILITAHADAALQARAAAAGAHCLLGKPFDEARLIECLDAALAADGAPGRTPDGQTSG